MSEKRLYSYDRGANKVLCNLLSVCDFNVSNVFQLLNSLADENGQLKQEIKQYWECRDKWKQEAKELKKENEQLRGRNRFLEEFDGRIETFANLKEENENLRKELDNFQPVMFQDVRKGTVVLYSKGDIKGNFDEMGDKKNCKAEVSENVKFNKNCARPFHIKHISSNGVVYLGKGELGKGRKAKWRMKDVREISQELPRFEDFNREEYQRIRNKFAPRFGGGDLIGRIIWNIYEGTFEGLI